MGIKFHGPCSQAKAPSDLTQTMTQFTCCWIGLDRTMSRLVTLQYSNMVLEQNIPVGHFIFLLTLQASENLQFLHRQLVAMKSKM